MRNSLTRHEMMNLALSQAGQSTISDLDTDRSEPAEKIKLFWKKSYQTLITSHPYNFSTKRVALTQVTKNADSPYSFAYEIPSDAWVIWDLYQNSPSVFGSAQRAVSVALNYYVAPFVGFLQFERGHAEVVDGRIASDGAQLNLFYTTNDPIPETDYGPYFVEEMIAGMQMMMLKDKKVDVATLGIHSRLNDKESAKNRKRASNENNQARRIPRADILNAVDIMSY